jgi:hypothetical protein
MNTEIVNSIALLEIKLKSDGLANKYERQLNRIHNALQQEGFEYSCPLGEAYSETRTDLEVTIGGDANESLSILQVIKPIIYQSGQLVQKGIVIAGKP